MVESCDVGSLPFLGDHGKLLEGARNYGSYGSESTRYFEEKVLEGFLDKVRAGIDTPNYPQFRDMNEMFLEMIKGVKKVKEGYMETDLLSLNQHGDRISEVEVIRKNSPEIYDCKRESFRVRICVTGPYTLSSLFIHRDRNIFSRLGKLVSKIIGNNVFSGKYGRVGLVCLDEPVFGLIDDPIIDRESEGRENLRGAWESIFHTAKSKGAQTCLHLHRTTDELFWQVDSLDVIGSHVDDPIYIRKETNRSLESTDKFLKVSLCLSDFDRLIRQNIIAASKEELSETFLNKRVAEAWQSIRTKNLDPEVFIERVETMKKRLIDSIRRFGGERVAYVGPECGLGGFPTYECALECLNRVSKTIRA